MVYESELYHHGILGQKWGIRRYQNKDGTLTNKGKQRYSNAWKEEAVGTSHSTKVSSIYSKAGLSAKPFTNAQKQLRPYADEVKALNKEADQMFKDYGPTSTYHAQLAGAVNSIANGDKKLGDIAKSIWFYDIEDGDQSFYNSNLSYIRSKGKVEEAVDLLNRHDAAAKKYQEEARKAVSNILGEYGDEPITKMAYNGYSVSKSIVDHLAKEAYGSKDTGTWNLKEAVGYASDLKSKEAQKYYKAENTAKELVAKMTKNGKSSWNLLSALEKAGLENVDYDKMTNAQWARLEKELDALGYPNY